MSMVIFFFLKARLKWQGPNEGACKRAGLGLSTRACSDRRRGNGFKLKEHRFRLDIRNSLP